jgi:hypothetical protein
MKALKSGGLDAGKSAGVSEFTKGAVETGQFSTSSTLAEGVENGLGPI